MINVIERPSIVLKEQTFDYSSGSEQTKFYTDALGAMPFVNFQGTIIEAGNIIRMELSNKGFMPELYLEFKDPTNKMIDENFPLDNSVISIFKKADSEMLMMIRMDFKIMSFNPQKSNPGDSGVDKYILKGVLDVSPLYYSEFKAYKGTSFDVLKTLALESTLGFATNIDKTDDAMTWINPANKVYEFINIITNASYRNDDAFLWSYVDFYYNLNYIDIETQMKEDTTNMQTALSNNSISGNEELAKLVLTNNSDYNDSNMYINKYNLINNSTQVNMTNGYKFRVRYYDKTDKNYNSVLLDTISTTGKYDNQIIMKSQPNDMGDAYTKIWGGDYVGKMDQDNMHKNYLWAYNQNKNNLDYLQMIKMNIELPKPNYNLYRFQLVPVEIYEYGSLADNKSKKLNVRLSGDWLITGINFIYKGNTSIQEITLTRRELTAA